MSEKIPVVICIFNNSALGMVRQMQQLFYGKRYEITDLAAVDGNYYPDFIKWADSYSCKAIRVTDADGIKEALETARANKKGPTVIDFLVSPDDLVLPMVKGGTPLNEMILK